MNVLLRAGYEEEQRLLQVEEEIAEVRQRLLQVNAWPKGGDEYLALLPRSHRYSGELSEMDVDWLPRVVRDALAGKDIGQLYPAFFQELLLNNTLRLRFLQQLREGMEDTA